MWSHSQSVSVQLRTHSVSFDLWGHFFSFRGPTRWSFGLSNYGLTLFLLIYGLTSFLSNLKVPLSVFPVTHHFCFFRGVDSLLFFIRSPSCFSSYAPSLFLLRCGLTYFLSTYGLTPFLSNRDLNQCLSNHAPDPFLSSCALNTFLSNCGL